METSIPQTVSEKEQVIPKWILFLAKLFIPSFDREIVLGDVVSLKRKSTLEYLWGAAEIVGGVLKARMQASFGIWLLMGEVIFLYVPVLVFKAGTPFVPFVILFTILLIYFRIRDAFVYPAEGTGLEMVVDTGLGLALLIGLEAALTHFAPRLALEITRIILCGVLLVIACLWRKISRHEDSPNQTRRELTERLIAAWHMNVLFLLSSVPIILRNLESVPVAHWEARLLGAAPGFMMYFAKRFRKAEYKSHWAKPFLSIKTDPDTDVLSYRRAALWYKDRTSPFPADLIFEFLYFLALVFVDFQAVWRWVSNDPLAIQTDWLQLIVDSGAVLLLAILWTEIKNRNRKVADAIQKYIDENASGTPA